jgi:peptide/nickel transport system substrate-binding protein
MSFSSRWLPALIAATSILVSACAGSTTPTTSPSAAAAEQPQRGGTLRLAIEQENAAYHPCAATASFSATFVNSALFDQLMRKDAKGNYQPTVADAITPDADGKVWTVKLKTGIVYHDGTPLNASTVKATIDELRATTCFSAAAWASVEKVEAPDPTTVVVTLKAGNVWFTQTLSTFLLFKPGLQEQFGKDFGAHPMGSGPFKFVQWDRDQQLTVERNPNYWRKNDKGQQLPYLDRIIFRPIANADTRLASVRSGDLDTIMSSDPALLKRADELSLTVNFLTANSGLMWIFNGSKPPTNDARVRRAFAYATDKAALVAVAGGGDKYSQVMSQWYSPSSAFFSKKVDDAWPKRDLTKAKAEMDKYVNDPNRNDRKPVGSPVTIALYSRNLQQATAFDQVTQDQWKALGSDVQVKTAVEATFLDDVRKGAFDVALFNFGDNDPYTQLAVFLPESGSRYFTKYDDPTLKQKIAVVQKTPQDRVAPVLEDVWMYIIQEMPIIPVAGNFMGMASNKNVRNGPFIYGGFNSDFATVWMAKQ